MALFVASASTSGGRVRARQRGAGAPGQGAGAPLGERGGPVRSLGLYFRGGGEGVEAGGGVATGERLLLELGDHIPVLGVDEHEDAGLATELQHLEEVFVLGVKG